MKSFASAKSRSRGPFRPDFQDYFSTQNIARELCKARVRLAEKRDEALFFHNIDRSKPSAERVPITDWGDIPTDIFPPRKLWHRFRPRDRSPHDDVNLHALVNAVRCLAEETPQAPWVSGLRSAVEMIHCRALSDAPFVFTSPTIRPEVKDRSKNTFRPVASFTLADKIIDCLTARYFRETLDSALLESCLAFRPRKNGRNDGLDLIVKKRLVHSAFYVAECDIQGFFDCVSHSIAREALEGLIADAQYKRSTVQIDPRALEIFDSYLSCYSFIRNVREGAELELKKRIPDAQYPWPEEELAELHGLGPLDDVGVPQGGALSGVVANALMHVVDKEMRSFTKRHVTYLRYCDDMVLLAPEPESAEEAFDGYCTTVRRLKLPIHCPHPLPQYKGEQKRDFWKAKSKPVFKWASPMEMDAYPWIQFLGFQIRYDGMVRIRRSSLDKHLVKLTQTTGRLLSSLQSGNETNIRRSPSSIAQSLKMRLISMGVGRRKLGQRLDGPLPKCWANGFRWLSGKNVITNNLRALDRQRERQINRVVRGLKELAIPERPPENKRERYGFPFSYFGQFSQGVSDFSNGKTPNP